MSLAVYFRGCSTANQRLASSKEVSGEDCCHGDNQGSKSESRKAKIIKVEGKCDPGEGKSGTYRDQPKAWKAEDCIVVENV